MPKMKLRCHNRLDQVWFKMKTRQDNDMIDLIDQSLLKSKLNYQDLSNSVQSMIKTEQNYELTDRASAFYSENNTKLS